MSEWNDKSDEILRGKLKYYASETPEHLWEKIDARRTPSEDTDDGIVGWWRGVGIGLFMLTLLGGFAFMTTTTDATLTAKNTKETTKENLIKAIDTKTTFDQDPTILEPTSTAKEEGLIPTISKQESSSKIDLEKTSVATTQLETQLKTVGTSNDLQASEEIFTSKGPSSEEPSTTTITPNNSGPSSAIPQIILPVGIEKNTTKTLKTKKETAPKDQAFLDSKLDADETQDQSVEATKYIASNLSALVLKSKLLEETQWSLSESMSKIKPNCYNFRRAMGYGYYVDFFIAPEYAFRSLKPKSSEFQSYADAREETESFKYAFSTGVRFSMVNQQGFTYRTGIVYSNITERFDYEGDGTIERHLVPVDTVTLANGDIDILYEVIEQYPATRKLQVYNQFKMIDIPIILGYEFETEKYVLSINGGAYFNILFKPKGTILGPNLEPMVYTLNEVGSTPTFTERVGISAFGSIGFGYKIKHNLQLLIEPNFRYQLKPISIPGYTLSQRYMNVGVMLGMRYKF